MTTSALAERIYRLAYPYADDLRHFRTVTAEIREWLGGRGAAGQEAAEILAAEWFALEIERARARAGGSSPLR